MDFGTQRPVGANQGEALFDWLFLRCGWHVRGLGARLWIGTPHPWGGSSEQGARAASGEDTIGCDSQSATEAVTGKRVEIIGHGSFFHPKHLWLWAFGHHVHWPLDHNATLARCTAV